jgi:hypothetical protein
VNCTARIRTIRPYGDILPHRWNYGAWKYGCLFACVDFISRAIPKSLSFRPTACPQGTVVHLLSHSLSTWFNMPNGPE